MAKSNEITIALEDFIKESRISACFNFTCRFHSEEDMGCCLKSVEINMSGKCRAMELRDLTTRGVRSWFNSIGIKVRNGGEDGKKD